jgi:hypothetical protein
MSTDSILNSLKARLDPLERVIRLFSATLGQPKLVTEKDWKGFRYEAPDKRHFCLLKAVRVVSALNASIELARKGFAQELLVLMRTLVECTTHIEFVAGTNRSEELRAEVEKYVRDFFADSERPSAANNKAPRQGKVHTALGKSLDDFAKQYGEIEDREAAQMLYSNIYRSYSNYVHAKYPECMDLFGGRPGHFHLDGMSGTPKDGENTETVEACITTASLAFVAMIRDLNLMAIVNADPVIASWYGSHFAK